jgi:thiol:disulfide interchange protein DsbC
MLYRLIVLAAILGLSSICLASEASNIKKVEADIRASIKNIPISSIQPFSPIPGLYEVRSGNNIFYTDSQGKYIFSGHVYRTADRHDLTAERLEDINRVDFGKLPLNDAIVSGDPEGTPVAIFTDPDCPYCRKLEEVLPKVKGVKIYTFLFPLEQLHPQAKAKAERIWCAKDRHKAMQDVMLNNVPLDQLGDANCSTPVETNIMLGRKLGIRGTPTLIASDGRKHSGMMQADQLETWAVGK